MGFWNPPAKLLRTQQNELTNLAKYPNYYIDGISFQKFLVTAVNIM